ncbi:DNA cytosine methyltransferase [Saccharothrix sp. NRRL B-16314]|uniref:DNA cytosine methyltransferase n=1 Tax=Saccharothrix sp. NRRL B-16314 TaxID=1463825 RepID=UPI0009E04819|nr:DNA cytosine methyltransferase [Saccharothrix sp. NRRL B-16314]
MTVPHDVSSRPTAEQDLVLGSLCTGYGGLDLGVLAALGGGRVAWVADPDPHVRTILATRAPGVPNLGDISTVDWDHVEEVDIITAGFPCQDISAAGKGLGIRKGARSGIWRHVVEAVRRLRPPIVIVENVAALRWRNGGLGAVLGDLADIGYDANWTSVRASDVGAPHRRERVFILAFPQGTRFIADHDTGAATDRGRRPTAAHTDRQRLASLRAADPLKTQPQPTAIGRLADRRRATAPHTGRQQPNDGESPSTWLARQTTHKTRGINGNGMGMPLSIAVRLLPTPRATDRGTTQKSSPGFRPLLSQQVLRLLPTPRATEGVSGSPRQRGSKGDLTLSSTILQLPVIPGVTTHLPSSNGNRA